jgi:hypothetical protein
MSLEDVDACTCEPAAWSLDVLLFCYFEFIYLSLDDTCFAYVG